MATAAHAFPVPAIPRTAFSRVVRAIEERVELHRAYRCTLDELSALSDRDLADLGLHRSEIARVAKETVYGPRG